jgi:hypothetical protein
MSRIGTLIVAVLRPAEKKRQRTEVLRFRVVINIRKANTWLCISTFDFRFTLTKHCCL